MADQVLQGAQGHQAEAQRQDQIGNGIGNAQGRRHLGHGELHADVFHALRKDECAQDQQTEIHHDPAQALNAGRQPVVNDVHPDVAALADGQGNGQIGDPDEDIAGQFLGPDRQAHIVGNGFADPAHRQETSQPGAETGAVQQGQQLGDGIAVDGLVGDDPDHQEHAHDQKGFFQIGVKQTQKFTGG